MILLQSCNTFKVRETVAALEDSITSYNVALRWGMYKDAYSYHFSSDGKQPPAKLDGLEEISVTGIKVTEKIINTDHLSKNINSKPNIFLMHGDSDQVVTIDAFLEAKDFFKKNRYEIETKIFENCEHRIPTEGSSLGLQFIKKHFK